MIDIFIQIVVLDSYCYGKLKDFAEAIHKAQKLTE